MGGKNPSKDSLEGSIKNSILITELIVLRQFQKV